MKGFNYQLLSFSLIRAGASMNEGPSYKHETLWFDRRAV